MVASVPVVGSVTLVVFEVVSVREYAPDVMNALAVVRLPDRDIDRDALFMFRVSVRSSEQLELDVMIKSPAPASVIFGDVRVLFVRVSVVALPTKVSVDTGSVIVIAEATLALRCTVVCSVAPRAITIEVPS